MDLIVATNNAHKLEEIRAILGGIFENIYSLKDKNIFIEPIEDGETFLENAEIKARAIYEHCSIPTLADDSGLCVDALDGAPGIYSARYAGQHGNDSDNNSLLLKNLQNVDNRSAHFACAIVLITQKKTYRAIGKTEGRILHEQSGTGGFGYDPIFFSDELQKSFGTAKSNEKNSISHRGKALAQLVDLLVDDKKL